MPATLQALVPFIAHYGYLVLFPVAVIEGPIITVVAGFLASLGYMNAGVAYVIIVIGDLVGDTLYYLMGRYGGEPFVRKYGRYFGVSIERLERLKNHFHTHTHKTFIAGKLAHGVGAVILVAAGVVKMPYKKFLLGNIWPTIIKSLLLLILGYYFGRAYSTFDAYFNYAAIILPILLVVLYIGIYKFKVLSKLFRTATEDTL